MNDPRNDVSSPEDDEPPPNLTEAEGTVRLIRNRKVICAPSRPVLRITRGRPSGTNRSGMLLMYVVDRDPLEHLQEAAKHRRNTPSWTRVQAIVLAKQGDATGRIAHSLGCSRRAVQTWVAA